MHHVGWRGTHRIVGRLFPGRQWAIGNYHVAQVLGDISMLRLLMPFLRRIVNLDGKVWEHRYWYDESKDVVHLCSERRCNKFVVRNGASPL